MFWNLLSSYDGFLMMVLIVQCVQEFLHIRKSLHFNALFCYNVIPLAFKVIKSPLILLAKTNVTWAKTGV